MENKPKNSEERGQALGNLYKAAKLYSQAAGTFCLPKFYLCVHSHITADEFPEDDEEYCIHKKYALDRLFTAGAPLSVTLPLVKSILHELPLGQAIWRWSVSNAQGVYDQYRQLEEFHDAVQEAMKAGQIPPGGDGGVSPPWADPVSVFGSEAVVQSHYK